MKTASRTLQLLVAVLVIVVGLSAASVRVLFPNADRYRGDLESWLAGIAGQPVAIGSLEAEWRGWGPEFRINDLRLRDPTQRGKDGGVNAHFESATVTVDVIASLLGGELRPRHIHIGDVSLRANRAAEAVGPDEAVQQHVHALLQWLLAQHRLRLDATRVELSDIRVAGKAMVLTNLRLVVRNVGASHAVDAAVEIPGVENGAISARATLTGDPTSAHWSGDIAVDVEQLNLAALETWRHQLGTNDVAGRVSLSLESRWRKGALVEAEGQLGVRGLRVASAAGSIGPLTSDALIDVARREQDWQLRLHSPRTGFLSFREPTPLATLRYAGKPSQPVARVSAAIPALDVADLVTLLPLVLQTPKGFWEQLADAQPSGQIQDLAINVASDADGLRDMSVAGAFRNVGSRSSSRLPTLTAVSGEFEYDGRNTRVRLTDGRIRASLPDLFPEALTGTDLRGEFQWSDDEGERRLTLSEVGFVTPDVSARATGEILWKPDDATPYVDLSLGFSDGDLGRLRHFVPTHGFGVKTGAWLNQAFPNGKLTAGTVQLRGHLPHRLGAETDFSVTLQATVHGATVHYLDGWPNVERVAGTLHLAEGRLVGNVSEGYFFDARVRPSRFVVADILADNPVFEWETRIDGRTEDAMRYLRESPLREQFASLVDNMDASGKASLALELAVPLARGKPRLSGEITIAGNSFTVPSLREGFGDVAGRVRFDQNGFAGEDLTASYLGRRVTASIETVEGSGGHTRAQLAGMADAAYVARHLHNAGLLASAEPEAMPILTRLDGTAPWLATIDVIEQADGDQAPVVLSVESNLRGAALALPAPFGKPADAPMKLVVQARFPDADHRQMHLTLGPWATGIFDLRAEDGGYRLHRGAVRLGGEAVKLPDEGVLSVSGRMQRADVSEWSALVLEPRDASRANDALPTRVDFTVDRLTMLGTEFADVRIEASGKPGGSWRTSITGTDLDGQVLIPAHQPREPIVASFQRMVLTPAHEDGVDAPDPRGIPPVRFTCGQCTYGEMQLYDVELITSKSSNGLDIDSLRLRNEGFQARASGTWSFDESRGHRTSLDLQLGSDDLGKLLASLGHRGGATRGGATDVSLVASWDGPPSDFDLEHLDGVMHFRAGEGTLTDVSRGTAGRLFGLLVVPDLPRRLQGDFSDLFEDGFVYKQIKGTFNIERGNAYTNDLTLDGSTARIEIAGRTGLVDEDYDQLITVTPKLSESLPLMPIWLVERALQRELFNKLFAYQYTITGSWDEPSVTRIEIEYVPTLERS